jgi:large subunit ribosomal protein L10
MLTRVQKESVVSELDEKLERQKIAFLTDFRGISVMNAQELRRLLKKTDAEYKVAKKTLFDRALAKKGIDYKTRELEGEVGVAFCYGEESAPAKILVKFGKDHATFKILGAIFGNRILDEKEVVTLAKLPTREVLLAQIIGTLQAPIRGLATVLNANIRNLAVILQKVGEQRKAV